MANLLDNDMATTENGAIFIGHMSKKMNNMLHIPYIR